MDINSILLAVFCVALLLLGFGILAIESDKLRKVERKYRYHALQGRFNQSQINFEYQDKE